MKLTHFKTARIKLTCWYMLIVLCISFMFSFFIYKQFNLEVKRSLRMHSLRLAPGIQFNQPLNSLDQNTFLYAADREIYEELQQRIVTQLVIVNTLIICISTLLSYFLAGKTLNPIEQMLEEQKRFVADASHELRTPLTTLKTEIEVSLRDKKLTTLQAKKILESNLEEVNRMHRLTNYLLTLNNFDGSLHLVNTNIALFAILQKALSQVAPLAATKQIEIKSEADDLQLYGNSDLLVELFTILLDNAIKYSPNKTTIEITKNLIGKSVQVNVKDEGVGIKASDIPYIFNRFYRADTSRSKVNTEGYGLGLAIAKQIVEAHRGEIRVKSGLGRGTTFTVSLPTLQQNLSKSIYN